MNKNLLLVAVTLIALGLTPGILAVNAQQVQANTVYQHERVINTPNAVCGDHVCHVGESAVFFKFYKQWQIYKAIHAGYRAVNVPQSLDIMAPDGTCNITGQITTNGDCTVPQMVVSQATYASLQSDPFVGAVIHINPTQAQPTTTFCQIANWIVVNEDGYFSNIANKTALVDPPSCNGPVPVPEFGDVALFVMVIAIITGIAITTKQNHKIGF